MPQYKLKGLLAFAVPQKVKFGLIHKVYDNGEVSINIIPANELKNEYLL